MNRINNHSYSVLIALTMLASCILANTLGDALERNLSTLHSRNHVNESFGRQVQTLEQRRMNHEHRN